MEREASLIKLIRAEDIPEFDDNEFCVSITKAAELSGFSESQIRYLEKLPGVDIGKRGPQERNRIYTRQDVKLLWWIAQTLGDLRPSEIAEYLNQHQEEILNELGRITLKKVVEHEQKSSGYDILVSRLVALILSIWQEAALGQGKKADAVIMGVVFGPPEESWKSSFLQNVREGRPIDLAGSLVVWSSVVEEEHKDLYVDPDIIFGNLSIIFSHQNWYLPATTKKLVFDTSHFADSTEPFSTVILWEPLEKHTAVNQLQISARNVDELKKKLAAMLMQSLSNVLRSASRPTSLSTSVFSRGVLGRHSVSQGLSLLLETCIQPYFYDSYSYIAQFEPAGQLKILESRGNEEMGYLPQVLVGQDLPWWIRYIQKSASLALAEDATTTHLLHKGEHGSVICFPLIALDNVVGAMGIENVRFNFLIERDGVNESDLLRYLICISEIAAEYINLTEASAQKAERSKLAYASEETVSWWLDVYHFGGLHYDRFIERVCDWMEEVPITSEDEVNAVVVDIYRESELAAEYQGFELIIDIVRRTRERIIELIQSDPTARELQANKQLLLFDTSVGEHLLFATANIPKEYLLIFLEKIRRFWLKESGDTFRWKKVEIDVALQVGICHFDGLARHKRKMVSQIMNYHLRELANQLYERDKNSGHPLTHVIEYDAIVRTEKVAQ